MSEVKATMFNVTDALRLADNLLLSICEVETDPEKLFEAVKTWRRTKENFKRTEKSND